MNKNVYTPKMNRMTGDKDWIFENEDYDHHQDIARAAFADMLHDSERNQLYEQALRAAIHKKHLEGKKANVLDIGTGTGLLSMMAVRNGADSVIACEAFTPMSECASRIIDLNGFTDKIQIIPKRSTDIIVGLEGDMQELCNILVTEVFDTELIGEGALSTFRHAHKYLLEEGAIVVPDSATVFVQVVECPLAQNWHKLKNLYDSNGELLLKVPNPISNCLGLTMAQDIQLSQLPQDSFNTIISPMPVFSFDWSGKTTVPLKRTREILVKAERTGKAQLVFVWWELQMDTEAKIILSCAPIWAHPGKKAKKEDDIPWRDHWLQWIYHLPEEVNVEKDQKFELTSYHDEFSFEFKLVASPSIPNEHFSDICRCGLHTCFSSTRIGQMNDFKRIKKYLALFEDRIDKDSTVLVIGDGFYHALALAVLGVKKMYFLETHSSSQRVLLNFISTNNIKNVEMVKSMDELKERNLKDINTIISEPYFLTGILPWDHLLFLYTLKQVERFTSDDVKIFPQRVVIRAVAVHFKDLYKIRSPLGTCEGFKMDVFDKLIEASSNISDDPVEAQPLWEYPGYALSPVEEMISIDITCPPSKTAVQTGTFALHGNLPCNGIAIWTDWYITDSDSSLVTTGPTSPIKIGKIIDWYRYSLQGVTLFSIDRTDKVKYSFSFDFDNGSISCTFT